MAPSSLAMLVYAAVSLAWFCGESCRAHVKNKTVFAPDFLISVSKRRAYSKNMLGSLISGVSRPGSQLNVLCSCNTT